MAELHRIAALLRNLPSLYDADKRPIEAFSIQSAMSAQPTDPGAIEVGVHDKHGKKIGKEKEYVRYKQTALSELAREKRTVSLRGGGMVEERVYPDDRLHRMAEGEKLIE